MQLPARWIRGICVGLLAAELLCTVPWPWSSLPHPRQINPAWVDAHVVQYHSTALLQRSHAAMQYNRDGQQYETPPMAIWFHIDALFTSKPASGLAAWLDLLVIAKHPWAAYWLFVAAPQSWRVVPEQTQRELNLLGAGMPVMQTYSSALLQLSGPESWMLRQLRLDAHSFMPDVYVLCKAPVNDTTLQPASTVSCTMYDRSAPVQDDTDAGRQHEVLGSFVVTPDKADDGMAANTSSTAAAAPQDASSSTRTPASCPYLGPGLVLGPLGRQLSRAARQWRPAAVVLAVLRQLWRVVVPTGALVRPMCPLLQRLHMLSFEYPIKALLLQTLVLVVNARNWLYLVTVAYKISRRIALLAPAPFRARLSGAALTFVGMFLGLWQSVAYTAIDTALDIAMYKAIYVGLSQCGLAAAVAFWVWSAFMGEVRIGSRAWQLAKAAFKEGRMLVLAPQALLVQNQVLVDKLPRRQVATVGSWPEPLVIPEEVDELPVSEVPRGFICPITQAIMRQPALLLHDQTIAPSTYDKDSIAQWLSEHSSDPKNPGVQLCMKSVKLVYNGDLGRAIEDWVLATRQRQQQQQQQQTGLAAWRRALSGHLDSSQQHHLEGLAGAEGMAAAAAGVLMQMRGNVAGGGAATAAAAAAAAVGGGQGLGHGQVGQGGGGAGGAAHAAVAAGGGESGSILSGAGALVRTSSAAIAQVASMDLPAVAVAGLNQLAGTTRRIATRALTRRQQQQQQQQQQDGAQQQQQQQRGRQRRWLGQPQNEVDDDDDGVLDSGTDSDTGSASSGSSSEVESRQQPRRQGGARARQRGSRGVSPPEPGVAVRGGEEAEVQPRKRPTRSRSQPAAAAAAAGPSGLH